MPTNSWLRAIAAVYASLLIGCSASAYSPASVSDKFDTSVSGTKVLVQVVRVYKRAEIVDPPAEDKVWTSGWRNELLQAGYRDSDIVDGSEVGTISWCFAANSKMDMCTHEGFYMAHVPPSLQGRLVPNERQDKPDPAYAGIYARGDIVEIQLDTISSGSLIALVTGIRRPYNDWKDCRRERLDPSLLYVLSPLGAPQGVSLTCDGLEAEGWTKVPSAPVNTFEWRKSPSGAPMHSTN